MRSISGCRLLFIVIMVLLFAGEIAIADGGYVVNYGAEGRAFIDFWIDYKNFNSGEGPEIYLRTNEKGPNPENDFNHGVTCEGTTPNGAWQASNHIKFWYDRVTTTTHSMVNASHNYCLDYHKELWDSLNYLEITVYKKVSGTTVALENVTLNGEPLPNFVGTSGKNVWNIKSADLRHGFIFEADLILTGIQKGGENNMVRIWIGSFRPRK